MARGRCPARAKLLSARQVSQETAPATSVTAMPRKRWAGKVPEQVIREMAGWVDIPPTYFKTMAQEDVERFHRVMSPADRLGRGGDGNQRNRGMERLRGRL